LLIDEPFHEAAAVTSSASSDDFSGMISEPELRMWERYWWCVPPPPHRQVKILAAPFLVTAHRHLRRFYQQEAQQ
jgi:hypothetical protein